MSMEHEDDEENDGVSYSVGKKGPDREEMVAGYLPEQEDWLAKTLLEMNDPGRVAALRQFETIFPEVEDLQPVIDDFLDLYLKGQTSVGGSSRDEYKKIFQSMYGGAPEDSKGNMLAEALAADMYDED